METEKQIAETELPQLRQMVLENTRRIEKNELMISEMRMKRREEEQKQRERETYWDVARDEHDRAHREHERDMRELRKILHEHTVSFDAAMKRSDEKREKWHQEFDESLKKSREEDEERHRKFDEDLKKSREEDEERHRKFEEDLKKSREEFEERLKESDEKREKWHQEFEESLRNSREKDEERHRKFEEDLKKSREEDEERHRKFEEDLKKSREKDEERHRKFDEDLKKSREDFDRRMKESDEYFKKQREEDDKKFKARMDELDKSVNRATEAVSNLARQVSSVTGNIVEGLLGPASRKMFIDAGYPISRCCKRVQIGDKDTRQTAMEIDVMEYGETMLIAVEVKADCEKKDIRKILKKMVRFKELCPEHANKEVLAGVAAVNFEEGAYELAKESGLIIIHVKEESVFELEPEFTLDPVPDKRVLRRF